MIVRAPIDLRSELQRSEIAVEAPAKLAMVRPILLGVLHSLKYEVVDELGGYDAVSLKMLGRVRREGDGDCGICYEYAVHDAVHRGEPAVCERVFDALKRCRVPGDRLSSILFGTEKDGALQLIETAEDALTDDSRVLTGVRAQPPKLKTRIRDLAAAFRRPNARASLPSSIKGLWKADLFLGCADGDRWVGASVKINAKKLEGAQGLRVGIVPAGEGRDDRVALDEDRNLVVCPLPYDFSFMESFFSAWAIVQQFFAADSRLPKEVALPHPADRQVARELEMRRAFPVLDVIDALGPIGQPHLMETSAEEKSALIEDDAELKTSTVIAPAPLLLAS